MSARALALVDLAAIEHNCELLRGGLAESSGLCAVVKAGGYGHGAVPVARAALAGGARSLAVAAASEAAQLRAAGIGAPILVMGALDGADLALALDAGADVVAWRERHVARLVELRRAARVHVKLDTGMGRLGTRDAGEALRVARAVHDAARLELVGAMTHFATADGDPAFLARQLAEFEPFAAAIREIEPRAVVHAANSAATLREPAAHFDLVRCGIAIYGLDPFGGAARERGLRPALSLRSYVADVKPAAAGQSAGYGRRFVARCPTRIATVPLGYGDGVRRALGEGADVLIRGRRHPLAGTVSMDNITVDVGAGGGVEPGDEVVLIGSQGDEEISAEELARRLGTINYEIVTAIPFGDGDGAGRVERRYRGREAGAA